VAEIPNQNFRFSEQWEGVLVSISDMTVASLPDGYNQWRVRGVAGGIAMISDLFDVMNTQDIVMNEHWHSITGLWIITLCRL